MSEKTTAAKGGRPKRSIDEEIQLLKAKLKQKEDKKNKQLREQQESNRKAILELIRSEKLDAVSSDAWKSAMPRIKELLAQNDAEPQSAAKPD